VRAFLSIKYWGDFRNQEEVRSLIGVIEELGLDVYCVVEHAERWGQVILEPRELLRRTFEEIDKSDLLIANVADWPIGVGVEAGYAFARGIPVLCIWPEGSRLANTVAGLAEAVVSYCDPQDLKAKLEELPILRDRTSNERR